MSINHNYNNCKIYTPNKIAKWMIEQLEIDWDRNIRVLEPAVGTGNIFIELLESFLNHFKGKEHNFISKQMKSTFWCFDLDSQSLLELKENIKIKCSEYGFKYNDEINIEELNIMIYDYDFKFDYIICNPPYVNRKSLKNEQIVALSQSETCTKFNFDIYFYFFEKSINWLAENGSLVFITPNSFLNSASGYGLRKKICNETNIERIINFPDSSLFEGALVKVCITVLQKSEVEKKIFNLYDIDNRKLTICDKNPQNLLYTFDHILEKGETLHDHFYISGGVATLNDKFFVIKGGEVLAKNDNVITFKKFGETFCIESKLVKPLMRPRNEKVTDFIIYPYTSSSIKMKDSILKTKYPKFWEYYSFQHQDKKDSLYYGRSQGLKHLDDRKLVFPKITSTFKPTYSKGELITSGIFLVPKSSEANELIGAIASKYEVLFDYLKKDSKNHGSDTYTISTTNLKKIPINLVKEKDA